MRVAMERIDSETESLVSYRSQRSQRSAYRREPTARGTYFTSVGLLLVLSRVVLYLAPSFTLLVESSDPNRTGRTTFKAFQPAHENL